jgi:hypothetical protein
LRFGGGPAGAGGRIVIAIVMCCRFAFGVNCKREGATLAKSMCL